MQLLADLPSTRCVSSTRLPVCAFGLWLFFCGFIGIFSYTALNAKLSVVYPQSVSTKPFLKLFSLFKTHVVERNLEVCCCMACHCKDDTHTFRDLCAFVSILFSCGQRCSRKRLQREGGWDPHIFLWCRNFRAPHPPNMRMRILCFTRKRVFLFPPKAGGVTSPITKK